MHRCSLCEPAGQSRTPLARSPRERFSFCGLLGRCHDEVQIVGCAETCLQATTTSVIAVAEPSHFRLVETHLGHNEDTDLGQGSTSSEDQ